MMFLPVMDAHYVPESNAISSRKRANPYPRSDLLGGPGSNGSENWATVA
jgi:hypothetical protein